MNLYQKYLSFCPLTAILYIHPEIGYEIWELKFKILFSTWFFLYCTFFVFRFKERVIRDCKNNGYVTTLKGRRRYLPNINLDMRAERQAVNSTIQGSASDMVKKAMIDIDKEMSELYPSCTVPLRRNSKLSKNVTEIKEGAHFILQLHDELYYEVWYLQ